MKIRRIFIKSCAAYNRLDTIPYTYKKNMKVSYKAVQIAAIMAFIFWGCKQDDPIPDDPTPIDNYSFEGVYVGNTYEVNKGANQTQGNWQRDSSYADTFYVSIIANDTIVFENNGGEWKFKSDPANYYLDWYGTHSNREFEINTNGNLTVEYSSYSGDGAGSYTQNNKDFDGMKQ